MDFGENAEVVDTYTIPPDEERGFPERSGIVFIAKVENPEQINAHNHQEFRWIDLPGASVLEGEKVPGFDEVLRKAYEIYDLKFPG